ncbi:unnamed protein product [Cladocopium goreaui]|uniref:Protein NEDD1 n=1 Tax=Cladocopium goreaui TaxID=2562237 RepID=A0A9P1G5I9_9DINO|nr:unnamed protein product [Cladocopium goreaui]
MMERLSNRVSADVTSPDLNGPALDMSRSSFTWPSAASQVPPLPNERHTAARELPETPQDSRQVARYSIGSPDERGATSSPWWKQVAEMSAHEPKVPDPAPEACLKFEAPEAPAPVAPASPAEPVSASAVSVEALKPLLAELRNDFRKEVQEAQLALMEQNFQLHAQLRKDQGLQLSPPSPTGAVEGAITRMWMRYERKYNSCEAN